MYPYKIKIFDFDKPYFDIFVKLEQDRLARIPNNDKGISCKISANLKPIRHDIFKGPDSRYGDIYVGLKPHLDLKLIKIGKHTYYANFKKLF